jgi:hypothetical protein
MNLHMNSGRNMKPKPVLPFMFCPEFMWAAGSGSPSASNPWMGRLSMTLPGGAQWKETAGGSARVVGFEEPPPAGSLGTGRSGRVRVSFPGKMPHL